MNGDRVEVMAPHYNGAWFGTAEAVSKECHDRILCETCYHEGFDNPEEVSVTTSERITERLNEPPRRRRKPKTLLELPWSAMQRVAIKDVRDKVVIDTVLHSASHTFSTAVRGGILSWSKHLEI